MDVVLIYFSQSGNTRKVANAMAEAFLGKGHVAKSIPLKEATSAVATGADLIGFGTPCFSSQAPTPMKSFLKSLLPLDGKRAFVFATSSGAPGRVLYDMTSLLRDKGAEVLGGFLTRGQVHHPAPHMIGQFRGHPNKDDLNQVRRFAIDLAEHVNYDWRGPLPGSRPDALKRGLGFYDVLGSTLTDRRLRRMMPEPEPDPSKCDQCNWCVEECPMDNITLHSYPILGERCIRCYHCLNGCPQGAFKANWRYIDPLLRFLYNPSFMRWFGDIKPGEPVY